MSSVSFSHISLGGKHFVRPHYTRIFDARLLIVKYRRYQGFEIVVEEHKSPKFSNFYSTETTKRL